MTQQQHQPDGFYGGMALNTKVAIAVLAIASMSIFSLDRSFSAHASTQAPQTNMASHPVYYGVVAALTQTQSALPHDRIRLLSWSVALVDSNSLATTLTGSGTRPSPFGCTVSPTYIDHIAAGSIGLDIHWYYASCSRHVTEVDVTDIQPGTTGYDSNSGHNDVLIVDHSNHGNVGDYSTNNRCAQIPPAPYANAFSLTQSGLSTSTSWDIGLNLSGSSNCSGSSVSYSGPIPWSH